MKAIYQDLSPEDRLNTIQAMSEGSEEMVYTKNLSREELDEYRENLTDSMVKIDQLESEFKMVKEEHAARIKPLKADNSFLLGIIKRRAIDITEQCYLIPDYDGGMMEYYNANGELVHSRRLKPEERQTSIKSLKSAM